MMNSLEQSRQITYRMSSVLSTRHAQKNEIVFKPQLY